MVGSVNLRSESRLAKENLRIADIYPACPRSSLTSESFAGARLRRLRAHDYPMISYQVLFHYPGAKCTYCL